MPKFTKLATALVLATSLSGCVGSGVNPSVTNAAAGAALGGTAAVIAGGSRSDVAATALVGAIAGSAIPVQ